MKRYVKSSSDGSGRKYEEIENNVFHGDLPCYTTGANFDSGTVNDYEDQWADISVLISLIYKANRGRYNFLDHFLGLYHPNYEDYDDFVDNFLDPFFNSAKNPSSLLEELERYCRRCCKDFGIL